MNRRRRTLLLTLFVASAAFPANADEIRETRKADSCSCPKEGAWKAQNLKGWMNCTGPVNIKQTLAPVKDEGTIWVLDEKCTSIFSEASRKQDEDILMNRKEDSCDFSGTVSGDANGVQMVIDVNWPRPGEVYIEGDMSSKPSFQGMTCEYYRPYQIRFDEKIPEGDYADRKKKMLKKLEKIRAKI